MRGKLKAIILVISFCMIYFLAFSGNVDATNYINSVYVDVYVQEDGSAKITENWDVDADSGTELYKPYSNLGKSEILNFKVKDSEGNEYTCKDYWLTTASFREKKYKCGINKNSSDTELCWGISKYGKNEYTLTYELTNLIDQYKDGQGIYFSFMPKGMSPYPKDVSVTIHSDISFSEENSKIWAFECADGEIFFKEGAIVMDAMGRYNSNKRMTILALWDENLFTTENTVNMTIKEREEKCLRQVQAEIEAEERRKKYEQEREKDDIFFGFITMGMTIITLGIPFILMFALAVEERKKKKLYFSDNIYKLPKQVDYFRDIPCEGNILEAYWLCKHFKMCKLYDLQTNLIGSFILKWINENKVIITKTKSGLFSFKDNDYALNLVHLSVDKDNIGSVENRLIKIFLDASGEDLLLEPKEFEKWNKRNFNRVSSWFEKVEQSAMDSFTSRLLIKSERKRIGLSKTNVKVADPKIREYVMQIKGFKKFLEDFSTTPEKQAIEVKLWREYLIFGQLLGIANKVQEQFSKLYPEIKAQMELTRFDYITTRNFISSSTIKYATSAYRSVSRSIYSGGGYSGGHSGGGYSSGGGGSSFSGGGGGSRGSSSGSGIR